MPSPKHLALVPFMLAALLGAGCSQPSTTTVQVQTPTPTQPTQPVAANTASLDATNCNPGTSIDPIDKGKSFQTNDKKYTLLDVRVDDAGSTYADYKKVILVKLQIENISQNNKANMSIADVDLTRNHPPVDQRLQEDFYDNDLFYNKANVCVNLATDVKQGTFPAGKKVVGYFVFGLPDNKPYTGGLFFGARYLGLGDVAAGVGLKVAGTFKIK